MRRKPVDTVEPIGAEAAGPIGTLARGLAVLDIIVEAPQPLNLAEIAAQAELDQSTTLRLLRSLEDSGYVLRPAGSKRYLPSPRAIRPLPLMHPLEMFRRETAQIVRELVTSILRTADFEATPVGDGAEALQALAGGTPDLIISDVEMPRVDGFELLRRVRERWPRLPMVMLTTRGSDEDRRRAATLGANAYLVKAEFEQSRLLDTVRRLIGGFA